MTTINHHESNAPARLNRRAFVRLTGGAAVAGLALPLLAACAPAAPQATTTGGSSGSSSAAASSGKAKYPSYITVTGGPKPDLPPRADGVDAGYFSFPKTLFKSVKSPVGSGDDVTLMTNLIQGAIKPMEQNDAWQAVNKDMGITVRQQLYSSADYRTGLNTTIAGGNLPDTLYNPPGGAILNLPQFLQAQCADLTPYLAGDAVKDYPNLANFPTPCWAETVYNGSIYAVPVPRAPFLNAFLVRKDIVDKAGLALPTTADEFKKMLLGVTNAQQNHYGLAAASGYGLGTQAPMLMIFGVPNNWSLDTKAGKLVKDYETDQYKAAVGFARDLFAAGVYHPQSATLSGTTLSTALRGGQGVVASHSFGALIAQWTQMAADDPNARLRVIHPFSADGKTRPIYHTGPSNFGVSLVKKGTPDRVKLLLRVLNYIAAPFGSQERTLLDYGVEGVHYTLDANGIPVVNEKGRVEALSTWKYITNNPQVLFMPDRPEEYATDIQTDEKAMADVAIADPTLGLYSQTYAAQRPNLDQGMMDGVNGIVSGQRPLSDLDGLVNDWRNNGGEKSRAELQQALAGA